MAVQRATLVIADIGGYTKFMSNHRIALSHAQDIVGRLLEAVIDAAKPFKLAKLEGDAAFLYSTKDGDGSLGRWVNEIRSAFLSKREEISQNRICTCHGCTEVDKLNLKFVAHVGDVGFQKIKQFTELAGVDVILVHRMLKNDVPAREYVLVTDAALQQLDPAMSDSKTSLMHDFEGLGPTSTHFVNLAALPPPPIKPKSFLFRLIDLMFMNFRALPYFVNLKEPCQTFHNVEKSAPGLPASTPAQP